MGEERHTFKLRKMSDGMKCWDLPAFSFERIGLYFETDKGEKINFCDVHFSGTPGDRYYKETYYTGPKNSIKQALRHMKRSKGEVQAYIAHDEVGEENDIANGGKALLSYRKVRDSFEVWLFGPLLLEGKPYGSIVVEMIGWKGPKYRIQHDPKSGIGGKIAFAQFPADYVGQYRRCKLWGSVITPPSYGDLNYYNSDLKQHLSAMVKYSWPVELSKSVRKVLWKVEAASGKATDCHVMEQHG